MWGDSITLGRLAGIRVGINWTWLIVFALIVWTWATAIFPDQNPGLSDEAYVGMAVVGALLFFLSLLLHEYGHALQARRDGMEIEGITLWLFGGVAKFRGRFPSAGAEFRIAIAGPLVSLVIGGGLILFARLAALPAAVDGVAAWLGYINLVLLVFNLLPALPLDGGRVLRSVLWHFKRDLASATHIAARIGQGFGYLFIAGGVFLLIFQGTFSGAWLAFIGWFLLQAASAEDRDVTSRRALQGLRVRDLMIRDPVTVRPDTTISQFMDETVWNRRYTTYPVTDDGRTLGLLPFRCVAGVPRSEWDVRTVEDCMLPKDTVPIVTENDELIDAAMLLSGSDVHRALVVEDERLVGLLSATDVARALQFRAPRGR